jgi:golgi SNAP receptor complex member 1
VQTETLFHTYSQFSSTTNISPKPSEEETRTETQIRDLLESRDSLISQLSHLLDSESALTSSALKQNNLARHREVLAEHQRELTRIKGKITDARNRANLLSNVRSDIDAYRTANPEQAEADYMLHERGQLDDSHRVTDGVLSQAYAINDSFTLQRESLASINRRIKNAASQFPGINNLINRISSKKRRDAIILGVFIALCFLLFLYFQ